MASTYSNLKIELMGTGDQSGTWGVTTNTNLGTAIEEAITGSADVAFSSADVTLTLTNTNTAQTARNLRLNLTGTSGGARNLTVPNIEKFYIIANELADDVTVRNSTGTTYTVPAGTTGQVFSTGAGIKAGQSFFEGAILSPVAVILGGAINATPVGNVSASTGAFTTLSATGAITYGGVTLSNAVTGTGNMVLSASPTLTGTPLAPTAAPGTNTTQIATTAFVTATTSALGTMSTQNANAVAITGGTITGITDLAVADGGTGASTLSANAVLLGNGTSALQTVAPSTSGNVLTSNGTTWTSATPAGGIGIGQTWKALSLANNTNYTNSTSKPILVNIYLNDGGVSVSNVYVDGIFVGANYGNSVGGYSGSTVSAIVPVNSVIKYILGSAASASLAVLN